MGRRQSKPTTKALRQRVRYWDKKKNVDRRAAIILASRPKYVVTEFREVRKVHGTKYAVRFLKAKWGKRYL